VNALASVAVGLVEGRPSVDVELLGEFRDADGRRSGPGPLRLTKETTLVPIDSASSAFALDVTIGIGFHWERKERQVFRGALRVLAREHGLTAVNDIPLEDYVTSVISSEMSETCPAELLKAHAVISRSWLKSPGVPGPDAPAPPSEPGEIRRWYGREAHADFDVCADDHCQRYQGVTKALSPAAREAAGATAGEMLVFAGRICDARFSKACGGATELYSTAWEDRDAPYLASVRDAEEDGVVADAEAWIRTRLAAHCDTKDAALLARILPGFDQETADFYRWRVEIDREELGALVGSKLGVDVGPIVSLTPLERGPSARISRLRIRGENAEVVVGKELEIRRALSTSHLLSSALVAERIGDRMILTGAGWGHGVGLCQIGAAVMASKGRGYREILAHYYPGAEVQVVV
jgi:SpoIID/LytB domain protein